MLENSVGFAHVLGRTEFASVGTRLGTYRTLPSREQDFGSFCFEPGLDWFFGYTQQQGLPTAVFLGTDNAPDTLSKLVKTELLFRVFLKT